VLNAPSACGTCLVCKSKKRTSEAIPFSPRHKPRACVKPTTLAPLRVVKKNDECGQLTIIPLARAGHVGANLSLLGERAVGKKISVHWANERLMFKGRSLFSAGSTTTRFATPSNTITN
jgi:hypothetical protein